MNESSVKKKKKMRALSYQRWSINPCESTDRKRESVCERES